MSLSHETEIPATDTSNSGEWNPSSVEETSGFRFRLVDRGPMPVELDGVTDEGTNLEHPTDNEKEVCRDQSLTNCEKQNPYGSLGLCQVHAH